MKAWIGVDFDGTLAEYDGPKNMDTLGAPVPKMVERVKAWLEKGYTVKVFTARASSVNDPKDRAASIEAIQAWTKEHLGKVLDVTAEKDYGMIELWDDRAVGVVRNKGTREDGKDE